MSKMPGNTEPGSRQGWVKSLLYKYGSLSTLFLEIVCKDDERRCWSTQRQMLVVWWWDRWLRASCFRCLLTLQTKMYTPVPYPQTELTPPCPAPGQCFSTQALVTGASLRCVTLSHSLWMVNIWPLSSKCELAFPSITYNMWLTTPDRATPNTYFQMPTRDNKVQGLTSLSVWTAQWRMELGGTEESSLGPAVHPPRRVLHLLGLQFSHQDLSLAPTAVLSFSLMHVCWETRQVNHWAALRA
jgi:hypothetical protein